MFHIIDRSEPTGDYFLVPKMLAVILPIVFVVITDITKSMFNFNANNSNQNFKGLSIYSKDYFSPKDALTSKIELTENSFCIHHFSATWIKPSARIKLKIYRFINKVFGKKISKIVYKTYRIFNKTPNE